MREALHGLGVAPRVFKKQKGRKAKAVDIALTIDVLSHAYRNNYDAAVLYAGDGDYVPLVEEVKRLGKIVYTVFFHSSVKGMSPELSLVLDQFFDITSFFLDKWKRALAAAPASENVVPTAPPSAEASGPS